MKSGKPSGIRVVANKTDEGGRQAKLDLCFKFSSTNTNSSKYYYTVVKLAERTDVWVFNLRMKREKLQGKGGKGRERPEQKLD